MFTLYAALRSIAATHWPTADGELINVLIDENHDDESTYEPVVAYRYKIGSTSFESSRFAFGFMASSLRTESVRVVRNIIEQTPLKVYYHPRKPTLSVLLTGVRVHHIIQGFFYAVIMIVVQFF